MNKHATITQLCTSIQLLITAVIIRLEIKDVSFQTHSGLQTSLSYPVDD